MLAARLEPSIDQARLPGTGTVLSPVDGRRPIRAVLFDVDGTLYRQGPVRVSMAVELLAALARRPLPTLKTLAVVREFRRAQEEMRRSGQSAQSQVVKAAEKAGVPASLAAGIVDEWMHQRPLRHLRRFRADGLLPLLDLLRGRGLRLGVLSDYPCREKLAALGIEEYFSLVLSAADPQIAVFKPNPRGFVRASEVWRLAPQDVLVVGDRAEVDGAGATAAGMHCVIVGSSARAASASCIVLPTLERLIRVCDVSR